MNFISWYAENYFFAFMTLIIAIILSLTFLVALTFGYSYIDVIIVYASIGFWSLLFILLLTISTSISNHIKKVRTTWKNTQKQVLKAKTIGTNDNHRKDN